MGLVVLFCSCFRFVAFCFFSGIVSIPLISPFPYFHCSDNAGAGETITDNGDGGGGEESNPNNNELPDDEAHYQQEEQQQAGTKTIYSLNINVCRLCLCEGQGNLQPIFYSKDTPDVILQHKILELTTVEVSYRFAL